MMTMAMAGFLSGQSHHWTSMTGNQYNMTVYGMIFIDNELQERTDLEVGAFCGTECRATNFAMVFSGYYIVPLTIKSNVISGEAITFCLYDHTLNDSLALESECDLVFEANAMIGTTGEWYRFAFRTPAITNTAAGNWSNGAIWAGGTPPGVGAHVAIVYDCTVDANVTVESVEIDPAAKVTVQSGRRLTVTGDLESTDEDCLVIEDGGEVVNTSSGVYAKAEKEVSGWTTKDTDGWYLIASPVNGMTIAGSGFITSPETSYDLYRWNETTVTWENYKAGHLDFTTFENGRGYLYANNTTGTPEFTGTLNYATMTKALTCTSKESYSGVNIIGNPFPHKIYKGDGGAIDDNRLASGYYTMSFKGAWETKSFDDAIAPGQGILVVATEAMSLDIAKTTDESVAESGAKKGEVKRMRITVDNGDNEDRAFVYFSEGIGLVKLNNMSASLPTISVMNDDEEYAIAHMDESADSIMVLFKNTLPGDFTLTFEFMNLDFESIRLIDNITGEVTDLKVEPSYTFHANSSEPEGRFTIVMRDITGVGEVSGDKLFVYVTEGGVVVNGDGMLEVFDMTGRLVSRSEITAGTTVNGIAPGVYVMRLNNVKEVKTQRIVVR